MDYFVKQAETGISPSLFQCSPPQFLYNPSYTRLPIEVTVHRAALFWICSIWLLNQRRLQVKITCKVQIDVLDELLYADDMYSTLSFVLHSLTFQMTPRNIKCIDHERQDNLSCKNRNTLKSLEISERIIMTVCHV